MSELSRIPSHSICKPSASGEKRNSTTLRQGSWKVSFCSKSTYRRCVTQGYDVETRPRSPPLPTSRCDINMRLQIQVVRKERLQWHKDWVEAERLQNVARVKADEKHYLHILIGAAIHRQEEHRSNRLMNTVCSAFQEKSNRRRPSAVGMKSSKGHSEEVQFTHGFVAEKLMCDIDLVHSKYGYGTTLKACTDLRLWMI